MFNHNTIIGILLRNMNMYWSSAHLMSSVREYNRSSIYSLNPKIALSKLSVFLYIFLILYTTSIKQSGQDPCTCGINKIQSDKTQILSKTKGNRPSLHLLILNTLLGHSQSKP